MKVRHLWQKMHTSCAAASCRLRILVQENAREEASHALPLGAELFEQTIEPRVVAAMAEMGEFVHDDVLDDLGRKSQQPDVERHHLFDRVAASPARTHRPEPQIGSRQPAGRGTLETGFEEGRKALCGLPRVESLHRRADRLRVADIGHDRDETVGPQASLAPVPRPYIQRQFAPQKRHFSAGRPDWARVRRAKSLQTRPVLLDPVFAPD